MPPLVRLLRPSHWIKNAIVFVPLVFAGRLGDPIAWLHAALTFAAFSLASSCVYVLNDVLDYQRDQQHPRKKNRPIASGAVSRQTGLMLATVVGVGALALAWTVNLFVLGIVVAYLLLQVAYSLKLKHKMILDVMCIALGFVCRAMAGAAAIPAEISPWLLVCTFTLCLFMGFCKRRGEIRALANAGNLATSHRVTLEGYTPELLTHLVTLSASVAIMSFLQYATSEVTIHRFGTVYLAYTLPLVIYGICRFAMLSQEDDGKQPTDIIFGDRPLQATGALWLLLCVLVILYGREWQKQLQGAVPTAQSTIKNDH